MAKRDLSRSGEIWSINNAKTRGHKGLINRRKNGKIDYVSFTHSPFTQRTKNIRMNKIAVKLNYYETKTVWNNKDRIMNYLLDLV